MKKIPLPKGQFALVDDEDFERLNKFRWYIRVSKTGRVAYPLRSEICGQQCLQIAMHRDVMGYPPARGLVVDHINHDGLNNQKSNLRWANRSQNAINSRRFNRTGFRGVTAEGVRFRVTTANLRLGSYATAREAAAVYNWAARRLYGDFAILNTAAGDTVLAEIRPNVEIASSIERAAKRNETPKGELKKSFNQRPLQLTPEERFTVTERRLLQRRNILRKRMEDYELKRKLVYIHVLSQAYRDKKFKQESKKDKQRQSL